MSKQVKNNNPPKEIPEALKNFDQLPDSAQVRMPVVMALYGCSSSTILRGVKSGHIPEPDKLTPRTRSWGVGKLRRARTGNLEG